MSIFNWIKAAVIALFAGLIITVKVLLGRNKTLKREVAVKDKHIEIKVEQQKVKDEVSNDEPERIEELKGGGGSGRASRINSVLNNRGT